MFRGRIELIIGPMFAGKTTELMRRVKREIHARRSCFVIKYAKDTRYDVQNVSSHDQLTLRAQASVSSLEEVQDSWKEFDVVAVDEGQFFQDLVPFCNAVANSGRVVMVSALDGDYLRKPFGHICDLIPHCESVEKLTAVCMMCHNQPASFTRRTVDSAQVELIGGAEMYIAACRECYNATKLPSQEEMVRRRDAIREMEMEYLGTPAAKKSRMGSSGTTTDGSGAGIEASRSPKSAAETMVTPPPMERGQSTRAGAGLHATDVAPVTAADESISASRSRNSMAASA